MAPKPTSIVSSITKTHYTINGMKYDRVTSILDYFTPPGLVDWYIKEGKGAKQKSKIAKSIGTRVHNLIKDDWQKGKYYITDKDSQAVLNCMEAYKNWRSINKPEILSMEQTVWSEELGIAGTYDILLPYKLVDIKTSDSIRDSYWIQLAMYIWLKGFPFVPEMAILRLDKLTGEYEYKSRPFEEYYVKVFKGLLNYYRYYQKPEVKDIENVEVLENPFERSFI